MTEEFVSLKQLAEKLGMDRSHARRYILRLGLRPKKRRTQDSGNQLALTLTTAEAGVVLNRRMEAGFLKSDKAVDNERGVFYVVQLVPDLDPRRLKLGFAVDMNERLSQHRTAAPTAACLRAWPCRRSWESTVIDSVTRTGCRLIISEVYEADDVGELLRRGDEFFSLMPPVESRLELSEMSPLQRGETD